MFHSFNKNFQAVIVESFSDVIWKYNLRHLLLFLNYSKLLGLQNAYSLSSNSIGMNGLEVLETIERLFSSGDAAHTMKKRRWLDEKGGEMC